MMSPVFKTREKGERTEGESFSQEIKLRGTRFYTYQVNWYLSG